MIQGYKSVGVAYLLWFFLGFVGGHRFYLGNIGTGILYFFTGGLFSIGWLIDVFLIPGKVVQANLINKALMSGNDSQSNQNQQTNITVNVSPNNSSNDQKEEKKENKEERKPRSWNTIKKKEEK